MNEYKVTSKQYLSATVTADVLLDTQDVAFSINKGVTWLPGVWEGSPGFARIARTSAPVEFVGPTRGTVLVRVTDTSEVPIVEAGDFKVTPL